jgi:hypothetical protein
VLENVGEDDHVEGTLPDRGRIGGSRDPAVVDPGGRRRGCVGLDAGDVPEMAGDGRAEVPGSGPDVEKGAARGQLEQSAAQDVVRRTGNLFPLVSRGVGRTQATGSRST